MEAVLSLTWSWNETVTFTFLGAQLSVITLAVWIAKLGALKFGFNKTLQTIFSSIFTPAKTTKLYLPRAIFLKLFNPGRISKEIYPYGSHSFTLNSSRWCFVKAS